MLPETTPIPSSYTVAYPQEEIARRITELGREIGEILGKQHSDQQPLTICILRGAIHFFSDLVRQIPISCEPAFCRVRSYGTSTNDQLTELPTVDLNGIDVAGRDILVIDDICDSGGTLRATKAELEARGGRSIHTAVLIHRQVSSNKFEPDFVAFPTNSSAWFVGYGMGDREMFSNLRSVYQITK